MTKAINMTPWKPAEPYSIFVNKRGLRMRKGLKGPRLTTKVSNEEKGKR